MLISLLKRNFIDSEYQDIISDIDMKVMTILEDDTIFKLIIRINRSISM